MGRNVGAESVFSAKGAILLWSYWLGCKSTKKGTSGLLYFAFQLRKCLGNDGHEWGWLCYLLLSLRKSRGDNETPSSPSPVMPTACKHRTFSKEEFLRHCELHTWELWIAFFAIASRDCSHYLQACGCVATALITSLLLLCLQHDTTRYLPFQAMS